MPAVSSPPIGAIALRRDFSPLLYNPTAWWDPSDSASVTLNSGRVSQINDKSGNARHLAQPTAGNQPLYETAPTGFNGRNAIYFSNARTSYMAYPLIWPSVDRSGFVAMTTAADVIAFALACSLADRALTEQMAGLEMSIALAETVEDVAQVLGAA